MPAVMSVTGGPHFIGGRPGPSPVTDMSPLMPWATRSNPTICAGIVGLSSGMDDSTRPDRPRVRLHKFALGMHREGEPGAEQAEPDRPDEGQRPTARQVHHHTEDDRRDDRGDRRS